MTDNAPRYGLIKATKTIEGYVVQEGDNYLVISKQNGCWWLTAGSETTDLPEDHPAFNFEYAVAERKKDLIILATYLLWPNSPLTENLAWARCGS